MAKAGPEQIGIQDLAKSPEVMKYHMYHLCFVFLFDTIVFSCYYQGNLIFLWEAFPIIIANNAATTAIVAAFFIAEPPR
ncbi:MAG: hypothetical protein K5989_02185 [Lachnospiraceae bacterium]|nr:hypothetical protein [Lachnospiraceae bacterium]